MKLLTMKTALVSLLVLLSHYTEASAARGDLVSSRLRFRLSAAEAAPFASAYGTPKQRYPVEIYELVYRTLDGKGKPVIASGAVVVPVGAPPSPLVSYQHGTVFEKEDVPSQLPLRWLGSGLAFASSGHVTVMPDYVGYGASAKSFHPYLHARSLAISVVDMLRATRRFAMERKISAGREVFLVGYSEGGYATLAAHREIEEHHAAEFTVLASAPMAGPYDLVVTMDAIMRRHLLGGVPYLAFSFWAYDRIYDLDRLRGIVREPYRTRLFRTFESAALTNEAVYAALPASAAELFEPAFLAAWKGEGANRVKEVARQNGLSDWKPSAPVALFHCTNDSVVPVEAARAAKSAFDARGSTVRLTERALGDHGSCYIPLMAEALTLLDSFTGDTKPHTGE